MINALSLANYSREERAVLTHCQVLREDLIDRMVSLNIVANIQPSFVPTDMRWVQDRLSKEKQRFSYAWRSLMYKGVVVAGGSDAVTTSSIIT